MFHCIGTSEVQGTLEEFQTDNPDYLLLITSYYLPYERMLYQCQYVCESCEVRAFCVPFLSSNRIQEPPTLNSLIFSATNFPAISVDFFGSLNLYVLIPSNL